MKKPSLFIIFILLLPIIDLITSLTERFFSFPTSVGVIAKGIFLLVMLFYLVFKSKSKYKKLSILYIIAIGIYIICYFITKPSLLNTNFLINEITYFFKFMFFPIIFLCLINYLDDHKEIKEQMPKTLLLTECIYIILLLIPMITGTSFDAYNNSMNEGVIGWFYAANEIGIILLILYPFLFQFNNKKWPIFLICTILTSICICLIGTKVSNFGLILITIVIFILTLVGGKKKLKNILLVGIILIFNVILVTNGSISQNMLNNYNQNNEGGTDVTNNIKDDEFETDISQILPPISDKFHSLADVIGFEIPNFLESLLSSRTTYFLNIYNIYESRPIDEKLLGIGFSNREEINDSRIEKLIEMDPLDIALRYGFIGFGIYFIFIFIGLVQGIKSFVINKFQRKEIALYLAIICLTLGVSLFAGHVLGAPSVSLYLAMIMSLLFLINKKEIGKYEEKN